MSFFGKKASPVVVLPFIYGEVDTVFMKGDNPKM